MKNIITIFFALILGFTLQAEKLTIVHEDWAEAQQMAKENNKLIIIDFYTTWCGPCKMFSANLKKNEELQSQLAENFIMLKYDAEKDKEFNLTKKFHVRAYPTFVIVSSDVQYADRLIGGALESDESVERFLTFTKGAIDMQKNNSFPKGYNQSLTNNYPAFYTKSMNREGKFDNAALKKYWASHSDYTSEISFAVMSSFGGSDKANEFYLNNKETFQNKFGKTAANQIVDRMVSRKFSSAIKAKNDKLFNEAKDFALKQQGEDANVDYMEYRFAQATKDCKKMEEVISRLMSKDEMSVGGINSMCWQIYTSECSDASLLELAAKWMESAKPLKQDYAFIDTYACILYKSKKYADAKTYMQRAIAKAKASGQKYDGSTKVLKLIEEQLK